MSLLEVVIAMAIFVIGIVGVLSLFSYALVTMHATEENMIARQLARDAMESVYGARNSAQYSWPAIRNHAAGGIFVDGATSVTDPGPDGIVNSVNSTENISSITTPDGKKRYLKEFKREVAIKSVTDADDVRQVDITITYPVGGIIRSYVVSSYISQWN